LVLADFNIQRVNVLIANKLETTVGRGAAGLGHELIRIG